MSRRAVVFRLASALGTMTVEPLDVDAHAPLLLPWVTHPRSAFWGMRDATHETVRAAYAGIAADPHHQAWLGRLDAAPLFLVESYDPAHSELAAHYRPAPGDVGMHVLVAPPRTPRHGLTSEVMRTVMAFLFDDERCRRVVVEPDVRNLRIAAKNAEAGFAVQRRIELAGKTAALAFCTRAQFAASPLARRHDDRREGRGAP